jgi:hypothetical protein
MAWGGHGLPKVSLGTVIPCTFRPCWQPPQKWPYSHVRGSHLHGRQPAAILYAFGHPSSYASENQFPLNGQSGDGCPKSVESSTGTFRVRH